MRYNYSKLKGKIVEVCGSSKEFAERIGINSVTLSHKMNGSSFFKSKEIEKAIEVLGIDRTQIPEYFFTPEEDHEH